MSIVNAALSREREELREYFFCSFFFTFYYFFYEPSLDLAISD